MSLATQIERFYRRLQVEGVIPLHEPEFGAEDEALVLDCVRSGWVSSVGQYVSHAENLVAEMVQSNGAVATINGTAALHLALLCTNVQPDDEVLVPALTFVATTNAIHYCAAMPHFLDVETKQLGICPDKLEVYLASTVEIRNGIAINRHTGRVIRSLIYVHIFGSQGKVEEVVRIAHRYNIKVIEDCAESLGSYLRPGLHTGVVGDVGAFSFNGNKIITCGGGGMLVSKHPDYVAKAKHLSTTAKVSEEGFFFHDQVGYNYRLPNLNAALLVSQLKQLSKRVSEKKALFEQIQDIVQSQSWDCDVLSPRLPDLSNHWLIAIKVNPDILDETITKLNASGIGVRPLWELNHTLPMNLSCPKDSLTNSELLTKQVICLPSSAKLGRL